MDQAGVNSGLGVIRGVLDQTWRPQQPGGFLDVDRSQPDPQGDPYNFEGLVVFDIDGDGWLDVASDLGPHFLNTSTSTLDLEDQMTRLDTLPFSKIASDFSVAGDFNRDGWVDFVSRRGGRLFNGQVEDVFLFLEIRLFLRFRFGIRL